MTHQLASLVPIIEDQKGSKIEGILILSCVDDKKFILYWQKLGNTAARYVNCIFMNPPENTQSDFSPGNPFVVDCQDIEKISIAEGDDNSLILTIRHRNSKQPPRIFSIDASKYIIKIVDFFYELLSKGIAVPSHKDDDPYSFYFYEKTSPNVYRSTPPHIQIETHEYKDLDSLWGDINDFFQDLVTSLDESSTLPSDPLFPLGVAATAAHSRLMIQIDKYVNELGTFDQITKDNVDDLFDEKGSLKNPQEFKDRIFHAGIEDDGENDFTTRIRLLPFIVGVYPLDSTADDRSKLDERLLSEYKRLDEQVSTIKKHQLQHDKKLGSAFRVITQDVERTDRTHVAFKASEKPGMTMLTRLLRIYCVYNPPISYLQGMNDIFVPLIHTYFPIWDNEGNPVDKDGNIVEHTPLMPKIFWDYEAMLRNINHLSLLSGVKEQCMEKARLSLMIISKVSPLITIWFRKYGLSDLLWMYSDFVLLFKRTFSSIWDTWLQFNVSPDPNNWLIYFTAAIIIKTFPRFACLQDVSITTIMDAFPKEIMKVNVKTIGNIALWLHEKVPFDSELAGIDFINKKEASEIIPPEKQHFDFFETDWTMKD
ncbi:hypothetical protein M9Y10_045103 [Tritrichomonas musculus]|uniref:Rab-GAP TBC domain-containing protein n=1 Tax=Tritrichomonas musculus TaxID=1915356 RepID=A0ABR2JUB5_9EUKA